MKRIQQETRAVEIGDAFKLPFSVFSACRQKPECIVKFGDVAEVMDKAIGRLVFRLSGPISANNFVVFDNLRLVGRFLNFQLMMHNSGVASIHIEVVTTCGSTIRLSMSTLYDSDPPRYFGRSLRLPLPVLPSWSVLMVDVYAIVERFCNNDPTSKNQLKVDHVKKIQACSNLLVRDVVTTNEVSNAVEDLPKDLSIKPGCLLQLIDLLSYCSSSPSQSRQPRFFTSSVPKLAHTAPASSMHSQRQTPRSGAKEIASTPGVVVNDDAGALTVQQPAEGETASPVSPVTPTVSPHTLIPSSAPATIDDRPVSPSLQMSIGDLHTGLLLPTGELAQSPPPVCDNFVVQFDSQPPPVRSYERTNSSQVRDRILQLERVLGYQGGPLVVLYEGRMMLFAAGTNLIMVDLENGVTTPTHGLWKAFNVLAPLDGRPIGQSFLKGHSETISLLELSSNQRYLASAECECDRGMVVLWDLVEGRRVASVRPCSARITSISFNVNANYLVTVGMDSLNRQQLVVWDIDLLVATKGIVDISSGATTAIIAKQISEYHLSSISCCPWDPSGFIGCGRENIRLWRVRKGHLPGRPIILNGYCRGYTFTGIAVEKSGSMSPSSEKCFFVASNKGMILKIDYSKECVVCAFQLHSGPILSFVIDRGYAVTGGEDKRLRIWPLDFSDYLLEARHEGPVSNVAAGAEGKLLAVGTTAGTLGILTVSEHSYRTVLRSHVKGIVDICVKSDCLEVATVSGDHSIRCWNLGSGHQSLEFLAEDDQPTCVCWHANQVVLLCGFASGVVRLFDTTTAKLTQEIALHSAAVGQLMVIVDGNGAEVLASGDIRGQFLATELGPSPQALFSWKCELSSEKFVTMAHSSSLAMLAVGFGAWDSVVVVSTKDWGAAMKLADCPSFAASSVGKSRSHRKSTTSTFPFSGSMGTFEGGRVLNVHFVGERQERLVVVTDQQLVVCCWDESHPALSESLPRFFAKSHNVDSPHRAVVTVVGAMESLLTMFTCKPDAVEQSKVLVDSKVRKPARLPHGVVTMAFRLSRANDNIEFSAPQQLQNLGASMTGLSVGRSVAVLGDDRGFLSFWRVSAAALRHVNMTEPVGSEPPPIIDAVSDPVAIDSSGPLDHPRDVLRFEHEAVEICFGEVPEERRTVHADDQQTASRVVTPVVDAFEHMFEDPLSPSNPANNVVDEDSDSGDEASLEEGREIGDTADCPEFEHSHSSVSISHGGSSENLKKLEHEFLLSMEKLHAEGGGSRRVCFSTECKEMLRKLAPCSGLPASGLPWTSSAWRSLATTAVLSEFSLSGGLALVSDSNMVSLVQVGSMTRTVLPLPHRPQPGAFIVRALAISPCEHYCAALLCERGQLVAVLWNVETLGVEMVRLSATNDTVVGSTAQMLLVDGDRFVVLHVDGRSAVVMRDARRATHGGWAEQEFYGPPCGPTILAAECITSFDADQALQVFICGSLVRFLVELDARSTEIRIVWSDSVKFPVHMVGATVCRKHGSLFDCALLALDNRNQLHVTAFKRKAGGVSARNVTCALSSQLPLPQTGSQVVLGCTTRSRNRLSLVLCFGGALHAYALHVEEISDRSIRATAAVVAKVRSVAVPRAVVVKDQAQEVWALVLGGDGQLSSVRLGAPGQATVVSGAVGCATMGQPLLDAIALVDRVGESLLLVLTAQSLSVWHTSSSRQLVKTWPGVGELTCMALSPDQRWLLLGSSSGQLRLLTTDSFAELDSAELGPTELGLEPAPWWNAHSCLKISDNPHPAAGCGIERVTFLHDARFVVLLRSGEAKRGQLFVFPRDGAPAETARLSRIASFLRLPHHAAMCSAVSGWPWYSVEVCAQSVSVSEASEDGSWTPVCVIPTGSEAVWSDMHSVAPARDGPVVFVLVSSASKGLLLATAPASDGKQVCLASVAQIALPVDVLGVSCGRRWMTVLSVSGIVVLDLFALARGVGVADAAVFALGVGAVQAGGSFSRESSARVVEDGPRAVVLVHSCATGALWCAPIPSNED